MTQETVLGYQTSGQIFSEAVPKTSFSFVNYAKLTFGWRGQYKAGFFAADLNAIAEIGWIPH